MLIGKPPLQATGPQNIKRPWRRWKRRRTRDLDVRYVLVVVLPTHEAESNRLRIVNSQRRLGKIRPELTHTRPASIRVLEQEPDNRRIRLQSRPPSLPAQRDLDDAEQVGRREMEGLDG